MSSLIVCVYHPGVILFKIPASFIVVILMIFQRRFCCVCLLKHLLFSFNARAKCENFAFRNRLFLIVCILGQSCVAVLAVPAMRSCAPGPGAGRALAVGNRELAPLSLSSSQLHKDAAVASWILQLVAVGSTNLNSLRVNPFIILYDRGSPRPGNKRSFALYSFPDLTGAIVIYTNLPADTYTAREFADLRCFLFYLPVSMPRPTDVPSGFTAGAAESR